MNKREVLELLHKLVSGCCTTVDSTDGFGETATATAVDYELLKYSIEEALSKIPNSSKSPYEPKKITRRRK